MKDKIKTITVTGMLITMLAATGLMACGACKHEQGGKMEKSYCPIMIEGAKVHVENTKEGVVIHITSKDEKVVKEIQEKCAKMQENQSKVKQTTTKEKESIKSAKYLCPMKCEGDKTYDQPGKCPKCGMNLEKKK